jgi:acetyl-CoA carboxylase biotin carboxyl carrier protein
MNIDLTQIQALLRILEKRDVTEFEFEDQHVRLRLVRGRQSMHLEETPAQIAPAVHASGAAAQPSEDSSTSDFITSPFVGTFYSAPGPGKPAFISLGDTVKVGQTVCIVEAMKLMNEIEAEQPGIIEQVLVDNGTPVEFGTKLFRYRKA